MQPSRSLTTSEPRGDLTVMLQAVTAAYPIAKAWLSPDGAVIGSEQVVPRHT